MSVGNLDQAQATEPWVGKGTLLTERAVGLVQGITLEQFVSPKTAIR